MVVSKKPDAVIFDWDNTLVDTWPIIYAALVETFTAFDMEPWPLERVKSNVKKSMRDSFPEVFGEDWQRAADIYQRAYRSSALVDLKALDGSYLLLDALTKLDVPLFVVSNKKGDNLRAELEHLGWNHYFKNAVGAGDAVRDKPHPDPVWHAIKPHGFDVTDNIWFIGDSDVDLECAQGIGCVPILFGEHASTMPGYKADALNGFSYLYHLKNYDDVSPLLGFSDK